MACDTCLQPLGCKAAEGVCQAVAACSNHAAQSVGLEASVVACTMLWFPYKALLADHI